MLLLGGGGGLTSRHHPFPWARYPQMHPSPLLPYPTNKYASNTCFGPNTFSPIYLTQYYILIHLGYICLGWKAPDNILIYLILLVLSYTACPNSVLDMEQVSRLACSSTGLGLHLSGLCSGWLFSQRVFIPFLTNGTFLLCITNPCCKVLWVSIRNLGNEILYYIILLQHFLCSTMKLYQHRYQWNRRFLVPHSHSIIHPHANKPTHAWSSVQITHK